MRALLNEVPSAGLFFLGFSDVREMESALVSTILQS